MNKSERLIDSAQALMIKPKKNLSPWELKFVRSVIEQYKERKYLSKKQKTYLVHALKRNKMLKREREQDEFVDELHEMNMQHFQSI